MAKSKVIDVSVSELKGSFSIFKKKELSKLSKKDYDFSGILEIRHLMTSEKARMLYLIKYEKPDSIYKLSKLLKRNFKSVNDDLKLLERLGIIQFVEEKTKKRIRYKPELLVDSLTINFKI